MGSKAEKKRLKRLNDERKDMGKAPIVRSRPKPKPLAIAPPPQKSVSAWPGKPSNAHPLEKLLAKDKITRTQYGAGKTYQTVHDKLEKSGVDCTSLLTRTGGGIGGPEIWLDSIKDARSAMTRINTALPEWEQEIIRKLCGEGWPPNDAIRGHWIGGSKSTIEVIQNVLEHLAKVLPVARLSWRLQKDAYERRVESRAIAS